MWGLFFSFWIEHLTGVVQQTLDEIIAGLESVSLINILIQATSKSQHDERLLRLLQRSAVNLKITNSEKSIFNIDKVLYLGYVIDSKGNFLQFLYIAAVSDAPKPTDSESEIIHGIFATLQLACPHFARKAVDGQSINSDTVKFSLNCEKCHRVKPKSHP